MAWIGGKDGIFRLHSSDTFCGSNMSLVDAAEIFKVSVSDLAALASRGVKILDEDGEQFVNELDLQKAWGNKLFETPKSPPSIGGARRSLDELILIKLAQISLPSCQVTPQEPAGRKRVDLVIRYEGRQVAVEFFGPSHFIPQYGRIPEDPSQRVEAIEKELDIECVIWPYWIQRCESNVRALFNKEVNGIASVWSTKAHFGDFTLIDAASVIIKLSQRFNAIASSGIGYMYTNERTPNKPVHPIVERILNGKENLSRLIPKGNSLDYGFWLPPSLLKLAGE